MAGRRIDVTVFDGGEVVARLTAPPAAPDAQWLRKSRIRLQGLPASGACAAVGQVCRWAITWVVPFRRHVEKFFEYR
jgi:hypothetical protein